MNNNEKKQAQPTKGAEVVQETNQPTAVQQAEQLQKEVEQKTKELQRCLEELTRKQSLSKNRGRFIEAKDDLAEAQKLIEEKNSFESEYYRITFEEVSGYNGKPIFSFNNSELLKAFIKFIDKKIDQKIEEIETELLK